MPSRSEAVIPTILRYAAFTTPEGGGNPAGVVLQADGMTEDEMQLVAAQIGYSETAFLFESNTADGGRPVRFYSPRAEVAFCGHATIGLAVAHAERHGAGTLLLKTQVGDVPVETNQTERGFSAAFVSVPPRIREVEDDVLEEALRVLRWSKNDLDETLPPRVANAGNDHFVLAVRTRERLSDLDYDFDGLAKLMTAQGWTTPQLIWRESSQRFHARNPFPIGGIFEDPATGAAAAALGGYLDELSLVETPTSITVIQGEDMGRTSEITAEISGVRGSGIRTSGTGAVIAE